MWRSRGKSGSDHFRAYIGVGWLYQSAMIFKPSLKHSLTYTTHRKLIFTCTPLLLSFVYVIVCSYIIIPANCTAKCKELCNDQRVGTFEFGCINVSRLCCVMHKQSLYMYMVYQPHLVAEASLRGIRITVPDVRAFYVETYAIDLPFSPHPVAENHKTLISYLKTSRGIAHASNLFVISDQAVLSCLIVKVLMQQYHTAFPISSHNLPNQEYYIYTCIQTWKREAILPW